MRHTTSPLHSDGDTTHNWELKTKGKLRSTSAHCANCATARGTAHEVRRSRDTDKQVSTGTCHVTENRQIFHSAWFSKHTTRLRIHTCACLKHSNFFNTDRMRKPPDCPTAIHMKPFSTSVFNNSDRDVSSNFQATQILRQDPCTQPCEHLCLLGSTNSRPTNQD